jgi:hypothetical protein
LSARSSLRLTPHSSTRRGAISICRSSGNKRDVSAAFSEQVVTFTAEQLSQEVPETAAEFNDSNSDTAHAPAGSNGHSYHTISANGNGNGKSHAAANGTVTNGHSNGHSNGQKNGNGHSNGHKNGNGNGHSSSNGNGHSNGTFAVVTPTSSSATDSSTDAEVPAAAMKADAAATAAELAAAAADLAATAWQSCVASQTLPGQQLSSTTFDCGVTVTISRDTPEPSSSSGTDADSDSDASMDAAAAVAAAVASSDKGCYYVRVEVPDHYGTDCVLHWGVENWLMPPKACQPPHSEQVSVVWCLTYWRKPSRPQQQHACVVPVLKLPDAVDYPCTHTVGQTL